MIAWEDILLIMMIVIRLRCYFTLIGREPMKAALMMVSKSMRCSTWTLFVQYWLNSLHFHLDIVSVSVGKEPYYMLSNHKLFLSNTRDDCCKKFYEWDFFSCTGTSPELTHGEFYPDYTDSSTPTCLDDGNIPTYMLNDQRWYLSTTLRQCCERHFHYNINACLGTSYGGSDKWYVKFDARTCAKDCVGASPCGGVAASWDELFDSKEKCCETKMFWDIRCRTRSV